jgi:hypothetical protein
VTNSLFTGNTSANEGGGIANFGTLLTVTNSTFSGNQGNLGGGVANTQALNVMNSTFSGNIAGTKGGGIASFGPQTTVTNSTFFGNTSFGSGGGIVSFDILNITNSTFSNNNGASGGAIDVPPAAVTTLRNTIVANSSSGGNCLVEGGGTLNNGGGNLSWPDTTCPGINKDPKLQPLANNGGKTQTMALGNGSAAINAGVDSICKAKVGAPNFGAGGQDQRGVKRPQGPHCDIGAYEFK